MFPFSVGERGVALEESWGGECILTNMADAGAQKYLESRTKHTRADGQTVELPTPHPTAFLAVLFLGGREQRGAAAPGDRLRPCEEEELPGVHPSGGGRTTDGGHVSSAGDRRVWQLLLPGPAPTAASAAAVWDAPGGGGAAASGWSRRRSPLLP